MDYHWWRKSWWLVFIVALALLILCFVPPIGLKINGSRRWIQVGFGTFQPSELAKVAVVFFTAWWFEKFEKDAGRFFKGFIFPMAIVSLILVPISRQEDLGYTALIGASRALRDVRSRNAATLDSADCPRGGCGDSLFGDSH